MLIVLFLALGAAGATAAYRLYRLCTSLPKRNADFEWLEV